MGQTALPLAGANSDARLSALEAQQARSNELLERIAANTGTVAAQGPPPVIIGDQEAEKLYASGREARLGQVAAARFATL